MLTLKSEFWTANCELQKKIAHAHVRAHSHVCDVRAKERMKRACDVRARPLGDLRVAIATSQLGKICIVENNQQLLSLVSLKAH